MRLADRAELATGFFARLRGLLGRSGLEDGEGLILRPCNSVHMFFMQFPIDVVFLDRRGKVVGLAWYLLPGSVSRIYPRACQAVELPAGTLGRTGTQVGDVVEIHQAQVDHAGELHGVTPKGAARGPDFLGQDPFTG